MTIRTLANRLTRSVNPNASASIEICTGYATGTNYHRAPTYAAAVTAKVQLQALTKDEVKHLDALNISNAHASLYADMQLTPVDRVKQSGGDMITIGSDKWLVVALLEGWTGSGWCKVAVSRQIP
jgi:hypothetical protein